MGNFLVLTLTAFVPGACSFPGSAWERGEAGIQGLRLKPEGIKTYP
jgi:hypothetical protein